MLVELFPNHDQIKNDQILAVWAKKNCIIQTFNIFQKSPKNQENLRVKN